MHNMKSRADRYPDGKRYQRKLEPWEYQMPLWLEVLLWAALCGIVYLVFA